MTFVKYCSKHRPAPMENADRLSVGERLLRVATSAVEDEGDGYWNCPDCRVISQMIFKDPQAP